jgi:ferredoxin
VYPRREFASVAAAQTRAQKKAEEAGERPIPVVRACGLDITPSELKQLQASDSTLARAREAASNKQQIQVGKNEVQFMCDKGILKRVYRDFRGEHYQVCVPSSLRKEVMRIAHDTPMSGHLGAKKTRDRIWSEFYWPGMCQEIRRYCQSCDQCQRISPKGRVKKVPLGRMPLMDQPFDRVAVDLVEPIACASRKLIQAEKNYATVEKECLAIVWGIEKFSPYLYGKPFTIQSDHQPLQHLQRMKTSNSRLMRWAMQLQPYNFHVEAIPGKDNVGADFLSRLNCVS